MLNILLAFPPLFMFFFLQLIHSMVHWAQNRKGKAMKKERKKFRQQKYQYGDDGCPAFYIFFFIFILYFIILFTFILLLYVLSYCVISCTIIPLYTVCLCLSVFFLVCLAFTLLQNKTVIAIYLLNANWLHWGCFLVWWFGINF